MGKIDETAYGIYKKNVIEYYAKCYTKKVPIYVGFEFFISNIEYYNTYYKQANIILRKQKLEKIYGKD